MHLKMALFRNFTRLQNFQWLGATRASPLLVSLLENEALKGNYTTQWRGISTPACGETSIPCFPLHFSSIRQYRTQSGSCVPAKTENQRQKTAPASKKSREHGSVLTELMSVKEESQPTQLTVGAKVVQAGRDFTYVLVVLGGFAVAGFLLWSVGREFFSSNSPQTIYSKALKRVKADHQAQAALGEPISGHGELSGRGRRREPLHQEYEVDGVTYMRMKFYVKGSQRTGTVHLDMKKNDRGRYELRFLFVELDGRPRRTVVIEDSR